MVIGLITWAPSIGALIKLITLTIDEILAGNAANAMSFDTLSSITSSSFLSSLLSIVAMLIEVPLAYALIENIMKAKRDNETTATYFLGRIFPSFGRAWKVSLWQLVKLIVPTILYTIGVFVSLAVGGLLAKLSEVLAIVIAIAGTIAIFVWYIGKALNLSLSEYIAIDNPEITAKEAVEKSIELMPGYRWKLICLSLSFIGWAILSACTLGIGDLFLTPYMSVASVVFYEEVLKAHGQTVGTASAAEPAVEPVVEEHPTQE